MRGFDAPDRLSGLETSFLALEDGGAHMHVGSCLVFEGTRPATGSSSRNSSGGCTSCRATGEAAFPPLRQARPAWVDDPHFSARWCPVSVHGDGVEAPCSRSG